MKQKIFYIFLFGLVAITGLIWFGGKDLPTAQSSAPNGYAAIQPTTSQITLGAYEQLQIFASSTCVSRIVSPPAAQIRILFEDSARRPSPGEGHLLTASSTNAFDSGLYGCGLWRAFNNSASTSIFTITEFGGFR